MQGNLYHYLGWHHDIGLFEAAFSTQTFSRHAHEGFAIGAIAEGAGGYFCRGENMILPKGVLSLMNPEEAHTGHAAAGQVRYNMLYVSETAVRQVLDLKTLRGFSEVAPRDREAHVSGALARLARSLNDNHATDWQLACEESVHEVLSHVFALYGRAELRRPGREPAAIRNMIERVEAGVESGDSLSLADLADQAGLTPSYLIRSSLRATGLTPHGHVLRARVELARRLLLAGVPAAEAALAAGFCDQAHLIRQFRRHYGVTPGAIISH